MGKIAEKIREISLEIPAHVSLVAVSKTKPNTDILEAYHAGQRIFGENKVQDMAAKAELLPKDIQWHFIGHLQTNKVKYIASFVSLIHAVDSMKLLKEINKQAIKYRRNISCLLQFHIASEETKFGLSMDDAQEILDAPLFAELNNITIAGVMGMATNTQDQDHLKREFTGLKTIFLDLKEKYFSTEDTFQIISMGMSGDYRLAIEEGSTMVRIGSSIFGPRNYTL